MSCYSCHNYLNQSKNDSKFYLQYRSKLTLEVTQFLLHKTREHQTEEQYQASADCDELNIKSDTNRTDSGKLRQYTTVSGQCEIFS